MLAFFCYIVALTATTCYKLSHNVSLNATLKEIKMQNELHISAEQANKNEDSLVRYTRKIIMLKVAKAKGRTAPRFPLSLEQ